MVKKTKKKGIIKFYFIIEFLWKFSRQNEIKIMGHYKFPIIDSIHKVSTYSIIERYRGSDDILNCRPGYSSFDNNRPAIRPWAKLH